MRNTVYIVARSRLEANQYAALIGLSRGDFRFISLASQIRGARNGEIHLVPGWQNSPQRHALRTALRFARIPVIDVESRVAQEPQRVMLGAEQSSTDLDPGLAAAIEALENEGGPSEAVTTTLEELESPGRIEPEGWEVAPTLHLIEDASGHQRAIPKDLVASAHSEVFSEDESTGTSEPSEDPAPTEEPKSNRRRSRCKDCDQLHYKGDPCPDVEGDE